VPPRPLPDTAFGPSVVHGAPVQVAEGVVRLTADNPSQMTGPGTNTYLVGSSELVVIDPGPPIEDHLQAIERAAAEVGGTIRWVTVTHHHLDHAPAARPLAERTGAALLAFRHPQGVEPDTEVGDGFVLRGPGFRLRALHTPGHASDHLCWLLEGPGILFSGDHVMQGSTVVIRPPDGNMRDYLTQLQRLLDLRPPVAAVAPGHGRMIGRPAALIEAIIAHRLEREAQVASALAVAGPTSIDGLLGAVYGDVAPSLLPVARFSLWAHLQKLALEGRARVVDGTDPIATTEASRWAPAGS
jgi:glyoxylase-like metal-dependent hydrolase (beta-lactamase superfamily II)